MLYKTGGAGFPPKKKGPRFGELLLKYFCQEPPTAQPKTILGQT